jgi:hypothetical protein
LIIEFVGLSIASGFYIAGHPEGIQWDLKSILELLKSFSGVVVFITVIVYIFFLKRVYRRFEVTEQGVRIGRKIWQWKQMRDFHMLGESQDERIGSTISFATLELVNPYISTDIITIRLKPAFLQRTLNLQVDPMRFSEFTGILSDHGINQTSRWKFYFGINKWFTLLVILPALLAVLYAYIEGIFTFREWIKVLF